MNGRNRFEIDDTSADLGHEAEDPNADLHAMTVPELEMVVAKLARSKAIPDVMRRVQAKSILKGPAEAEAEKELDDKPEPAHPQDQVGLVDNTAFHGVLGRLSLLTQSQTEANALFVLLHLLVFFGCAIGKTAHFILSTKVFMNLFVGLVGPSGMARKGTAGNVAIEIWRAVDEAFADANIGDGLNSGAGLLYHLRDPALKDGKVIDDGNPDKRSVFFEPELASVLMQGHRESEPNLCYVRSLFDSKRVIRSLTKDPTTVTDAHGAIIGHCTEEDLEDHLTTADKANGTANRFIWFYGLRSKRLLDGGDIYELLQGALRNDIEELKGTIQFARGVGLMDQTPEFTMRWRLLYPELEQTPAGIIGRLFQRAPVNVLKLSSIFALSDRKKTIDACHLDAALAIWRHAERSLRWIFRKDLDPDTERLMAAIKASPNGRIARTEASAAFGNNRSSKSIDDLLQRLLTNGTLSAEEVKQKRGRPTMFYSFRVW